VKNLLVGNLDSEGTHEELRRLFEAYGQVVQVHIIVDRDTGLPRGFAFVEMTNDAEVEKAIKALNGSMLRDRTLDVNYARPRPERLGERGPRRRGRRGLVGECFSPCAGIQDLMGQMWTITIFLRGSVARFVSRRNPGRSQVGAWPHPT
jgi:RNA recognition motif-containing protein